MARGDPARHTDAPQLAWPDGASLLVLSGGSSRRLGRDKATTHVGGRTLLDRLLRDVPERVPLVLVGPAVPDLPPRVVVVREDPPGSGPLAGLGAGVPAVRTPLVGLLAADMPFAVPLVAHALARLAAIGPSADALIPVAPGGQAQPLAAAYRTRALGVALARLGPLAGRPVRRLVAALRVMEWRVAGEDLVDVDTAAELRAARARAAEEGRPMEQWLEAVREALGLDVSVDVDAVLDVARDAAHNVERRAAPLTTFLLGAAVARGADAQDAAATVSRLATEWSDRQL